MNCSEWKITRDYDLMMNYFYELNIYSVLNEKDFMSQVEK